jgi:hypothetical protein
MHVMHCFQWLSLRKTHFYTHVCTHVAGRADVWASHWLRRHASPGRLDGGKDGRTGRATEAKEVMPICLDRVWRRLAVRMLAQSPINYGIRHDGYRE